MSTQETGAGRLRQISDELAVHESAIDAERPRTGTHSYYHGYGRALTLPDGRSYEAYAGRRMNCPGRLQIDFYAEARKDPNKLAALGYIILLQEDSRIRFSGESWGHDANDPTHTFPAIPDLARPLGDWLAAGTTTMLHERQAKQNAGIDFHDEKSRLDEYLMGMVSGEEELEESEVVAASEVMVRRLFAASERINAPSTLWSPSVAEVATFDEFVHAPGGVSMFVEADDHSRMLAPTRVPGPLQS